MRPRVAIIGGGISGLSAAYELATRAPHIKVLLLEAENPLGGVLTHRGGFLIESGADSFLSTPPTAIDICRRVGLRDSLIELNPARRHAFVVRNGRLEAVPAGFQVMAPTQVRPNLASPVLSTRGNSARIYPKRTSCRQRGLTQSSLAKCADERAPVPYGARASRIGASTYHNRLGFHD